MNTCRTVVTACVLALGALTAVPAVGQQALSAADGKSSIVPVRQGFLSLDFGQEKIGVRRYWERSADPPPTVEICGQAFPQIPNHSEWTLGSAVSAKDGKRSLFGKGTFTPGIETSVGFAHFIERGYGASDCSKNDKGDLSSDPIGRGYHALFLTVTGTLLARKAVEENLDGQIITSEKVERGIALSGGYNRSFGRGRVLGLALEGKRIANSPGDDDPRNVCVVTASGTNSDAKATRIEECEERFVAPLKTETVVQGRIDFIAKLGRVGREQSEEKRPFLGILTAASVNRRTGARASCDLAVGPTLHPSDKPTHLLGAVLFELKDVTNASGKQPSFKDKFAIRLYAGIPF